MNLRQLRYFITAVELGSVTRAAEHLHVAQPALGQAIRQLEDDLGMVLLHRHSRGVVATPVGELLYRRAIEVFKLLEQTRQELGVLNDKYQHSLRLGLTPSLMMLIGAELQLVSLPAYPNLHLTLHESPSFQLLELMDRKELDLALAYDVEPRAGVYTQAVLQEDILFVTASPEALKTPKITVDQVLKSKLAFGTERDVGRRALAKAAGVPSEALPVEYEIQSIAGIRALLLEGHAASLMPYGSVAQELATGQLFAQALDVEPPLRHTLYSLRRVDGEASTLSTRDKRIDALAQQAIELISKKMGDRVTPLPGFPFFPNADAKRSEA